MVQRIIDLARGLASSWIGAAGVVLTTSSFVLFLLFELLQLSGAVTNAYIGLISYLALPAFFCLGLLLIPIGWMILKRRTGKTTRQLLTERFADNWLENRWSGARLAIWLGALTLVNLLFLGAGSARMLQFMDQPSFCGTACHSVMGPEWATYQHSPHAHVPCVECHVGQGAGALIDSKINGTWQMISVTFDLFERPIPTPVHNLRPARETCEQCHWPQRFYGDRIETFTHYAPDETSTPSYSTLALKIGSGKGKERGEIHWHIASDNEVRYATTDAKRLEMAWVEVRQPDGAFKRFTNRRIAATEPHQPPRVLDCIDCHNRATHVYDDPELMVDSLISSGVIDRTLPFAKRAALGALLGNYASREGADVGIENDFRGFYARRPELASEAVGPRTDIAVDALVGVHRRNIHYGMAVDWTPYPDHRGHRGAGGCFRCHRPELTDTSGAEISSDCTLCHSILAHDSPTPFEFLTAPVEEDGPGLHSYLREEFLGQRVAP